jgi:hypothetical protein
MVGHFIPNPSIIIRWISRILQLLGRFRGLLSSQSIHCMHRGSMSSNITENYLGCNDLWSFIMHMVTDCVFIKGLCKQVQNALKLIDQNLQRLPVGKCSDTTNLQLQHLGLWTKLNANCNIQQFYEFQYGCFLTDLSTGCSTLVFWNNFQLYELIGWLWVVSIHPKYTFHWLCEDIQDGILSIVYSHRGLYWASPRWQHQPPLRWEFHSMWGPGDISSRQTLIKVYSLLKKKC